MPKMRTQCNPGVARQRAAERRDEILRSAAAVLRRHRSGALRMEQVARQLGLVKGNIYYYFKDRQDLIFQCHVRCMQTSLEAVDAVSAMKTGPAERLRHLLVRHIENIIGSEYGGALLADMEQMKPAQRRRYVAMRDRFEAAVRKLIAEGIAAGEFRQLDAPLSGFGILGAVNWMPKWYRADGTLKPAVIADWFANFFLHALKP
ncbi:MAG: TetR family transcriptional regulator [Burkholderiales bacterium]|nr:TetR family transcriptional regulator [Burkholderiales bacterium]